MTVAPAQVINLPLATDKMHATQSHALAAGALDVLHTASGYCECISLSLALAKRRRSLWRPNFSSMLGEKWVLEVRQTL